MLHNDGLARLTRNNQDLKQIYPDFGEHFDEHLIFGIEQRMIKTQRFFDCTVFVL